MEVSELKIENIKAVLLDLDGTLYDLKGMQKIMRRKIIHHLLTKPWKFKEILIVYYFRKDRKNSSGAYVPDFKSTQYRWLQRRFNIPLEELQAIVAKWMFELPLQYLPDLVFESLYPFLHILKAKKIPYGVHSDLPIDRKLEVLKIQTDYQTDAADDEINCLKPHPGGLMAFAKKLDINEEQVLVIGDKKDLDGGMAREGGSQFVLIRRAVANQQYQSLIDLFQHYPDPKN